MGHHRQGFPSRATQILLAGAEARRQNSPRALQFWRRLSVRLAAGEHRKRRAEIPIPGGRSSESDPASLASELEKRASGRHGDRRWRDAFVERCARTDLAVDPAEE